jgi:hypothetical protein
MDTYNTFLIFQQFNQRLNGRPADFIQSLACVAPEASIFVSKQIDEGLYCAVVTDFTQGINHSAAERKIFIFQQFKEGFHGRQTNLTQGIGGTKTCILIPKQFNEGLYRTGITGFTQGIDCVATDSRIFTSKKLKQFFNCIYCCTSNW